MVHREEVKDMTLSERIIAYRAKHNLSQAEFGKLVGLHYVSVSRIEKSDTCSKTTRVKIENLLNGK
jgi:DNA-binding XRE family transcriptional regulator